MGACGVSDECQMGVIWVLVGGMARGSQFLAVDAAVKIPAVYAGKKGSDDLMSAHLRVRVRVRVSARVRVRSRAGVRVGI